MLEQLKESVSVLGGYEFYDYYLFSKSGYTDEILLLKDENIHLITLSDLFKQ